MSVLMCNECSQTTTITDVDLMGTGFHLCTDMFLHKTCHAAPLLRSQEQCNSSTHERTSNC